MTVSDVVRVSDPRAALPEVEVTTDGHFAPDVPDHARRMVRDAVRDSPYPILRAAVRLVRFTDPALPRPVVSSALVNVNGRPVRVQTTASSAREGLGALRHSLRIALQRLDRHQSGHGLRPMGRTHSGGESELPPLLGTRFPTSCGLEEAISALDVLDHEFHLFHDVDVEEDTVVYRAAPTGYRVARVHHRPLAVHPQTPVALDLTEAPRLDVAEAAERMRAGDRPWTFFADTVTGRGRVLYVHRDGSYGLVTLE